MLVTSRWSKSRSLNPFNRCLESIFGTDVWIHRTSERYVHEQLSKAKEYESNHADRECHLVTERHSSNSKDIDLHVTNWLAWILNDKNISRQLYVLLHYILESWKSTTSFFYVLPFWSSHYNQHFKEKMAHESGVHLISAPRFFPGGCIFSQLEVMLAKAAVWLRHSRSPFTGGSMTEPSNMKSTQIVSMYALY